MKTVLVACGSGIATSTHVASKLEAAMAARGTPITTRQCRVQDIPSYVDGVDAVVTTSVVDAPVAVPVITGVAFLTGIGEAKVVEQVAQALSGSEY